MRLYGLIGYPLTHSFSKRYFSEKFEKESLFNCKYENFPIVSIDKLKTLLDLHPELKGLNVTIPYKEQVIPFLNGTDEIVQKTRACNCIKFIDRKLYGYNTDILGFEYSLKNGLLPHHRKALVLGTGGAARAVCYVLDRLKIEYKIVSRKPLVDQWSYEQVSASELNEYLLLINTTPLGMFPHIAEAPRIPYHALTEKHFLFDLIYNPERTLFLKQGEERGAMVKNGFEMLVIQAEESWKIWNR